MDGISRDKGKLMAKPQVYINVSQTLGIGTLLYLGARYLKLAEHRAGMERRSIRQVISDDISRLREKYDNFRYRQYRHF